MKCNDYWRICVCTKAMHNSTDTQKQHSMLDDFAMQRMPRQLGTQVCATQIYLLHMRVCQWFYNIQFETTQISGQQYIELITTTENNQISDSTHTHNSHGRQKMVQHAGKHITYCVAWLVDCVYVMPLFTNSCRTYLLQQNKLCTYISIYFKHKITTYTSNEVNFKIKLGDSILYLNR